jgi:hypothetical protein
MERMEKKHSEREKLKIFINNDSLTEIQTTYLGMGENTK